MTGTISSIFDLTITNGAYLNSTATGHNMIKMMVIVMDRKMTIRVVNWLFIITPQCCRCNRRTLCCEGVIEIDGWLNGVVKVLLGATATFRLTVDGRASFLVALSLGNRPLITLARAPSELAKLLFISLGASGITMKHSKCYWTQLIHRLETESFSLQTWQQRTVSASKVFRNTQLMFQSVRKTQWVFQIWPGSKAGASNRAGKETQQVLQRCLKTASRVSHMARRHTRFLKGV